MYTRPGALLILVIIPAEETIWKMKYVFVWFINHTRGTKLLAIRAKET